MKNINFQSKVEQTLYKNSKWSEITSEIPYLVVDNFPKLGLITSLRFLEWVSENPNGVISLPTGKTPEYFIKYTQSLLNNWESKNNIRLREEYGLFNLNKPDLSNLRFVQIDEFYPIDPQHHNSFYNYVMKYYIDGFKLKKENCLLINTDDIKLFNNKSWTEVFPDYKIDLSLRTREPNSLSEEIQKNSIFKIDNWCRNYEQKIREMGGIGFFLGGIGPDGHIAFNTRGSDHFSTTRLTSTNFETQAVAAGDLGGIEVSRSRLVITIGLGTITYNPENVSIIFAAGEAKADIIKASLENDPDVLYPASVLNSLPNSRFYLTRGAASNLNDSLNHYYKSGSWTFEKTERAIFDLCQKIDKYAHHLTLDDLKADIFCSLIPNPDETTVQNVIDSVKSKIARGMINERHQSIYHTGPHHDDIMLGIMPYTNRQTRSSTNNIHFSVLTSGFTAVTNSFIIGLLNDTLKLLSQDRIEMIFYPDFYEVGFKMKWDKDVYHFLNNVAIRSDEGKRRGICHRAVRSIVDIWSLKNSEELVTTIQNIIDELEASYDGQKNPPNIQKLKGMIREFEEELVWAHYGVQVKNIHHLRLGFYKGDIFTEQPKKARDVKPVLDQLRKYQPTILSVTMDPEGSGPDTHYKVLQVIAGAVREWGKEKDLSKLKIIGYRNVWFRFHPAEADLMVPVSLNDLDVLQSSFSESYMTQVHASFPSYEYDGKFSDLAQKIWVQQLKKVQYVLGKNFFYENEHPLLRATHGFVFLKELSAEQFISLAKELERTMEENSF